MYAAIILIANHPSPERARTHGLSVGPSSGVPKVKRRTSEQTVIVGCDSANVAAPESQVKKSEAEGMSRKVWSARVKRKAMSDCS